MTCIVLLHRPLFSRLILVGLIAITSQAFRSDDAHAEGGNDPSQNRSVNQSIARELEDLGLVFRDPQNSSIQELWLLGRFHGQYYWGRGDDGQRSHDYETRRMRLGFQAQFVQNLTVHAQMVSGSNADPFYNGFTELWARWEFSRELALTIGQQKHRFTHDRNVSSRYLNYLERSMLTNMFGADYTPGITIQGETDEVSYYTGVFSNATGQNMGEAFTQLDSGYSYLAAAYYALGEIAGIGSLTLHSTFLYSNANQNATNLNTFNSGLSAAAIVARGSASLVTEITSGLGGDRGDSLGINLQPGYFVTDDVQLVGRYQLAFSNDSEGLDPQRRYERDIGLSQGDRYQAVYLGLNYHIEGHRLKLQSGAEYSRMNNDGAWTFSTMVRFYFGPHSGGAFPMNQVLPGALEYD